MRAAMTAFADVHPQPGPPAASSTSTMLAMANTNHDSLGRSTAPRLPQSGYDERRHGPDPDRRRLVTQSSVASQPLSIRDGDRRKVGRAARADARVRAEPRPD